MGLFDTLLPQRYNGQNIEAGWFNTIRTALISIFGSGFIGETIFNGLASQSGANVTDLIFSSLEVVNAEIDYVIETPTLTMKSSFELLFDGLTWTLIQGPISGDDTQITFDVNPATGQVTYSSDVETFIMKYRAITFKA